MQFFIDVIYSSNVYLRYIMVNKKTNLEGYNNFIFKKIGKILQNLFQSGFVKILRKFVGEQFTLLPY